MITNKLLFRISWVNIAFIKQQQQGIQSQCNMVNM